MRFFILDKVLVVLLKTHIRGKVYILKDFPFKKYISISLAHEFKGHFQIPSALNDCCGYLEVTTLIGS